VSQRILDVDGAGFQYRIYPTPEQKIALAKTFGCARYVYNWGALNLRSRAWRERQKRINYGATSPVQQSLRHLQTVFVNFPENGAAHPSCKRRDDRAAKRCGKSKACERICLSE
jgi:putative transposase